MSEIKDQNIQDAIQRGESLSHETAQLVTLIRQLRKRALLLENNQQEPEMARVLQDMCEAEAELIKSLDGFDGKLGKLYQSE